MRSMFLSIVLVPFAVPAAAQTAPAPAAAPTAAATPAPAATPVAGATVYDPSGGIVGTIESVTATGAVVSTGNAKGALPLTAFAAGPKGLTIGLTKAGLEAAMQQAAATSGDKLKTQLTAGASVMGTGGAVVGTVKAADEQYVTLATPKGEVRLPINGFAAGPNGPVVGLTAAQLDAAVTSSKAK